MNSNSSFWDRLQDRLVIPGFSRIGYSTRNLDPDHPSAQGKTIVVTGATGGIGRETALRLASLGAHVVAVGRDQDKLLGLAAQSQGKISTELADLSLMTQTAQLADRLLVRFDRIDVLVNNVGTMFDRWNTTAEGPERTVATNLAGQFVLTNRLIPRLQESAPARIITVSSGGMYSVPLRVNRLGINKNYKPAEAYAYTKRAQVVLAEMWAQQLEGTGVVSHSMHPGWVDTPGVADSMPRFRRLTSAILRTPAQGADTIVWLATADEPATTTGLFWHDRLPRPTHRLTRTAEPDGERERLWDYLTSITANTLAAKERT